MPEKKESIGVIADYSIGCGGAKRVTLTTANADMYVKIDVEDREEAEEKAVEFANKLGWEIIRWE